MGNTTYKTASGVRLQRYSNGSFAYMADSARWINIPKELAIKLSEDSRVNSYTTQQMDDAYDKGFGDGNQRDNGSI